MPLRSDGLMMVLKGYGLSLNYPIPAHRPIGDIDVYLVNDNDDDNRMPAWKKGDEIIRQRGIEIDYSHHHHSVFSWKGQMVEKKPTCGNAISSLWSLSCQGW